MDTEGMGQMLTPLYPPIARALVQEHGRGRMEPEMRAAHDELARRGIPVTCFLRKQLDRRQLELDPATLVVGELPVVESALRSLGLKTPHIDTYPDVLHPFLGRRVWTTTAEDVQRRMRDGTAPFFVKPRDRAKRFAGFVCEQPGDLHQLASVSGRTDVWCADVVRFTSEYRVFVVHGEVVGMRHYDGNGPVPDETVIHAALAAWHDTGTAVTGFAADFGVLADGRTVLVELNDGYGLGAYGLDAGPYTDLLVARWSELAHDG